MTRGKRPYIPKVKGCYECSQRRIHCDKGQPCCSKCISKGLQCSGLGIRYRFTEDVVSKTNNSKKFKTQTYQHKLPQDKQYTTFSEDDSTSSESGSFDTQPHRAAQSICTNLQIRVRPVNRPNDSTLTRTHTSSDSETDLNDGDLLYSAPQTVSEIPANHTRIAYVRPNDTIEPWKRHLLSHFAQHIAPELVVINDNRNGWRHLILPIACLDTLVMDAVLSAAASHFAANVDSQLYKPDNIYSRAICRLQERQDLENQDIAGKQAVLLALLVLLSTVMVNGRSDFPTIFKLLESALKAAGGEDVLMRGELGLFVVRQIRKYRGYASALLSQEQGISRLSLTTTYGRDAANGWECFKDHYQWHPEFSESLSTIYDLNKLSCDIYVSRALAGPKTPPFIDMVNEYISLLKSFPPGTPGEHTLVFATFIVAAESSLPEHRDYFTTVLLRHYQRNGFTNLLVALEYLKQIWSNDSGKDWTQLLPELQVFVV